LENGEREEAISEQITAIRKRVARLRDGSAARWELDEEVEGEEEETQHEEEGAEGEAAIREATDGMKEAGGNYAEARLGTREIERADGFVAGQIAAERGEFIFYPEGEFFAVAPQIE